MNFRNTIFSLLFILSILLFGCKDAWEERSAEVKSESNKSLAERIASDPAISKFNEYLKATGLDKTLGSSNTYTVWAPSNEALSTLNTQFPNYLSDPAELKRFVQYHIGYLNYPLSTRNDTLRVKTLNGKFRTIVKAKLEEATITKPDQYALNGVFHVIDQANMVKGTIWDISHSVSGAPLHVNAMNSLDTAATVGGATIIKRNPLWKTMADTMRLDSSLLYTCFVLSDAAYNQEIARISPYYFTTSSKPDSNIQSLTRTALLKDLLVKGLYTADNMPDSLVSVNGVKFPVVKSAITASYRASNGVVHIVNSLPVTLKYKVPKFVIEGEGKTGQIATTYQSARAGNIYIRAKEDDRGIFFKDIEIHGHGVREYWAQYRIPGVHSVKYKVYARAVAGTIGDLQKVAFTQRYGIRNPNNNSTVVIFTHVVNPLEYREKYMGDYTMTKFGTLEWRLLSANSPDVNVNTLILDYIRFEPILP